MLPEHTFRVVLVSKDHGVGIEEAPAPDKTINYKGERMTASF
jgi:hypothetical protein